MIFHKPLHLRAVIFDLDGTLIDSIDIYHRILQTTFERLGIPPVTREDMRQAASDGEFNWQRLLPGLGPGETKRVIGRCRLIIDEISPRMFRQGAKLIPGALKVLREVTEQDKKIGLVTSTPRALLKDKFHGLKGTGIEGLFHAVITTDDVMERKPSAEPLLACGKRLGVPPKKSVYVGDAWTDVKAGKAAGMRTIGVLTGFDDYETLKREKPDGILESVRDLGKLVV